MATTVKPCLFCQKDNRDLHTVIFETTNFYVRLDNFPVTPGHLEVVPTRHVLSFFDLSPNEVTEMFGALQKAKTLIDDKYHPDGYNIGINEGEAAGRSVHHLHVHLIPRYIGDVDNPRGGVRNVILGKGDY